MCTRLEGLYNPTADVSAFHTYLQAANVNKAGNDECKKRVYLIVGMTLEPVPVLQLKREFGSELEAWIPRGVAGERAQLADGVIAPPFKQEYVFVYGAKGDWVRLF